MIKYLNSLILACVISLFGGMVYAADPDGFVCKYPTSFRDSLQVIRQDRPINVVNDGSKFSFSWGAYENYSDVEWHFKVNLDADAKLKMNLGWIQYDDDLYIFINGVQVFARVGGGTGGYTVNQELGQYFKTGENIIRVRLVNPIPTYGAAILNFSYSEGGCTPIDYTVPVCKDGLEGDACIDKLNSFCSEAKNAKYTDCIEWKKIQNQVQGEENNSGTTSGTGGAGAGAGGSTGSSGSAATLMFSPSAFAAQQSIGLIQQIFTCKNAMSEEEKALPNRLSANLCIYLGEYCSKTVRVLGVKLCRTKKKAYCCFNSTLARIINTEGNKQLGRNMGGPQEATCKGFTIDEFSRLDLSKMDLSEFVAEVTAKAKASGAKSQDYWQQRNTNRLENTWQNVDTEDMKYKILTSDNPYEVVSQPTDGRTSAESQGRVVASETEANTPTAKETGVNPVNQAELNEAKYNFSQPRTN